MSDNVIDFQLAKKLKAAKADASDSEETLAYHAKILGMNKLELLEEMVHFQDQRNAAGELTPEMMMRGRVLFKALEENAETEELRALARSFRRHLDIELAELRKKLQ